MALRDGTGELGRSFREAQDQLNSIQAELAGSPSGLAEVPGVHNLQTQDGRVRFDVDTNGLDAALRHLTDVGVRSLISQPPTLEELFLRHYQQTPTADERPSELSR